MTLVVSESRKAAGQGGVWGAGGTGTCAPPISTYKTIDRTTKRVVCSHTYIFVVFVVEATRSSPKFATDPPFLTLKRHIGLCGL